MTDLSPETVGKLVAHVRGVVAKYAGVEPGANPELDEARAIVAELPEPVDPDLVEAREIVASAVEYGRSTAVPSSPSVADFRSGAADAGTLITRTLAALKSRAPRCGRSGTSEIVDKLKSHFCNLLGRPEELNAAGYPRHKLVSGYDNMHTEDCPGCAAWVVRMEKWAKENGHVG